jgi:hypothetical protein
MIAILQTSLKTRDRDYDLVKQCGASIINLCLAFKLICWTTIMKVHLGIENICMQQLVGCKCLANVLLLTAEASA